MTGLEWLDVLRAFEALNGASRHPEDVCKRLPDALTHARALAADGYLSRSVATGYFSITDAGRGMVKSLEALP